MIEAVNPILAIKTILLDLNEEIKSLKVSESIDLSIDFKANPEGKTVQVISAGEEFDEVDQLIVLGRGECPDSAIQFVEGDKKKDVLVVLGYNNDIPVLETRAKVALDKLKSEPKPDLLIVPGTYAEAKIARRYLHYPMIRQASSSIGEAAYGVRALLENMANIESIKVVTSKWNIPRAEIAFNEVFEDICLSYIETRMTPANEIKLARKEIFATMFSGRDLRKGRKLYKKLKDA